MSKVGDDNKEPVVKKKGNIREFQGNSKLPNLAQEFLESDFIKENQINSLHLGVDTKDVAAAYQEGADTANVSKFYKDKNGEIKDYNNGKELSDAFEKMASLTNGLKEQYGDKMYPIEVQKLVEKTFESNTELFQDFAVDTRKDNFNKAKTNIINEIDSEITEKKKDLDTKKQSNPNDPTIDKDQKELEDLTVEKNTPKIAIGNSGGAKKSYAALLDKVNASIDKLNELSKTLESAKEIEYGTVAKMKEGKPTKDELKAGLAKAILDQERITGIPNDKIKDVLANLPKEKLKKLESSKIEIAFESSNANYKDIKKYEISGKEFIKAISKTDFSKIPKDLETRVSSPPVGKDETDVQKKTREATHEEGLENEKRAAIKNIAGQIKDPMLQAVKLEKSARKSVNIEQPKQEPAKSEKLSIPKESIIFPDQKEELIKIKAAAPKVTENKAVNSPAAAPAPEQEKQKEVTPPKEMPPLPETPKMPPLPETPKMPPLPEMPKMPPLPETPKMPPPPKDVVPPPDISNSPKNVQSAPSTKKANRKLSVSLKKLVGLDDIKKAGKILKDDGGKTLGDKAVTRPTKRSQSMSVNNKKGASL